MKRETLITAWARPASGPGWSNTPLWYLVRVDDEERGQSLEIRCLQPDQQGRSIDYLYPIAAAIDRALLDTVAHHIEIPKEI